MGIIVVVLILGSVVMLGWGYKITTTIMNRWEFERITQLGEGLTSVSASLSTDISPLDYFGIAQILADSFTQKFVPSSYKAYSLIYKLYLKFFPGIFDSRTEVLSAKSEKFRKRVTKIEPIFKAVTNNSWVEVEHLARQLKDDKNDISTIRLAILFSDLTAISIAATDEEKILAKFRYLSDLAEITRLGYSQMRSYSRLQRSKAKTIRAEEYELDRQALLEWHWWYQICIARRSGKLPVWEGLQIVRESLQV
jgi:hypothetical protein